MVYIQYKAYGTLETIDSFSTYKEAKTMLAEYRLSFSDGILYLSKRATKEWREASQRDNLKSKGFNMYLAWVGNKNTTYGTPHKITGLHDKYGELFMFKTAKERRLFCEQYNYKYNAYPVITNKQQAKSKYYAGCTQSQFNDYVLSLEYGS